MSSLKVSLRIWLMAILVNTILGVIYLGEMAANVGLVFIFGLLFSFIGSIPVFLLLWLVVNRCFSADIEGMWTFWITLITSTLFTLVAFVWFMYLVDDSGKEIQTLCILAVLSAIVAVTSQGYGLIRSSNPESKNNSHEN